jgi:hypothetical protein
MRSMPLKCSDADPLALRKRTVITESFQQFSGAKIQSIFQSHGIIGLHGLDIVRRYPPHLSYPGLSGPHVHDRVSKGPARLFGGNLFLIPTMDIKQSQEIILVILGKCSREVIPDVYLSI